MDILDQTSLDPSTLDKMHMTAREFKKLLVDLDISAAEIGRTVGISKWAVVLYFRGELKNPERRRAILDVLERRARQVGIKLPEIWPDAQKAA